MVNIGVFKIVPKVNEEDIIIIRTRGGVSTLKQIVNKAGTKREQSRNNKDCDILNIGTMLLQG